MRLSDDPVSKYLILKRISSHAMAVLGYLAKLKRVLGLSFGPNFFHDFSIKMPLNLFSISDKVSVLYLFPSQDNKQNVPFSSY